MKRKRTYLTINPKDFIHGPYIKCPRCNKNSFGILMICDHHYCRRCAECYYPRGDEPAAKYPLPELNKKIIYIDQFAISNMMMFLNPSTKAYQRRRVDPFWGKLFEKLDTLCKLQLVICPDSDFHRDESLLAPFYEPLKRMYELLSHGVSFYNHKTIQRLQILGQLRIWLGESKKLDLNVHRVTHGDINAWQRRFIFSLNLQYPQELIGATRTNRGKAAGHLEHIFRRWQSEKRKDFCDWYNEEKKGFAKGLVEAYHKYLENFAMVSFGLVPFQLESLLPSSAVTTFQAIKRRLREKGIKEKDLNSKLGEFLRSEEFESAPFIKIASILYAAMARKAATGKKKLPTRGFVTDVQIISTLLPYCDAMFIDKECRNFLMERPLCDEIDYGTRMFSLGNRNEFINYLDNIKSEASKKHLRKVMEVYGPDWMKPFWEIYKQ